MSQAFSYLSLPNLYYLMEGLSFNVRSCAPVIDACLKALNENTKVPDIIYAWNQKNPASREPLSLPVKGRIIVEVSQMLTKDKKILYTTMISEKLDEKECAPVVFLNMRSPTLNVPMRVEIPLRGIIKGGQSLKGTYSVYLHCLLSNLGESIVYYGITKRGWNARFIEHVRSSFDNDTKRLFPLKLKELINNRADQLFENSINQPQLSGIITAVCAIGLTEDGAMDVEEYLVNKYSLASKHSKGLNMIPGGREGIRMMHMLSTGAKMRLVETEERERALDQYMQSHPLLGRSNPNITEKWNDPAYAEAVICGRENRLSADQVREIRYLAALGNNADSIKSHVGAIDDKQVLRVLQGRTYARIN